MDGIIQVKDLSFSYGKKQIFSDVTFSLKKGCAAAVVGENGSGKSTLLACIAAAMHGTHGQINVSGKTAYIPQETSLVEELSFNDNLKYFASLAHCKVPKTLPFDADKYRKIKIKHMSGGMKKLCSIACTLLTDADIYLFDEPCAALDRAHREMFLDYTAALARAGKTVLYAAHDREEYMRFADTAITIENKKLHTESMCEVAHA